MNEFPPRKVFELELCFLVNVFLKLSAQVFFYTAKK